jgi:hypothetical protein
MGVWTLRGGPNGRLGPDRSPTGSPGEIAPGGAGQSTRTSFIPVTDPIRFSEIRTQELTSAEETETIASTTSDAPTATVANESRNLEARYTRKEDSGIILRFWLLFNRQQEQLRLLQSKLKL